MFLAEAWVPKSIVILSKVGTALDRVGQEPAAKWTVGDDLDAKFPCHAQETNLLRFDLKSKVHFVVNEKFDRQLEPSSGSNSKTFLLTSGELETKVWLDKNCYFPGILFSI